MFTPMSTCRLILRSLAEKDLAAFTAYRADPEIARYQSWSDFTLDNANALLAEVSSVPFGTVGHWFQLAMEDKVQGKLIGDLAVHFIDGQQHEIGFTIAPDYQNQGFAKEAALSLMSHLFGTLSSHRVVATTDAENQPAAQLLFALGFRQEAHLIDNTFFKGQWGSEFQFALLQREWQELQA